MTSLAATLQPISVQQANASSTKSRHSLRNSHASAGSFQAINGRSLFALGEGAWQVFSHKEPLQQFLLQRESSTTKRELHKQLAFQH